MEPGVSDAEYPGPRSKECWGEGSLCYRRGGLHSDLAPGMFSDTCNRLLSFSVMSGQGLVFFQMHEYNGSSLIICH